uniref:Slc6a-8 n=1 Tax=Schmidtea mediterranea TaxID=79327 RepID=A0A0H3YK12_SCHMD|nr:slc6a-8 [Schmidtea mediterranea]
MQNIELNESKLIKSHNNINNENPSNCRTIALLAENSDESKNLENHSDPQTRKHWASQLDFLFSIIGFAVDFSNVFRFPYICFQNGGGAFLIPYFVTLLLCALPMFYIELLFGQYMRCGGLTIWKICPLFKGVGYASVLLNFYVALYYNVIIAWSLYYLFVSFSPTLPWTVCDKWWNSENCYFISNYLSLLEKNNNTNMFTDSATEYLENNVLMVNQSSGIGNLGPLKWNMALSLLLLYIIIYLCLFKGVKFLGKAVWVTAILPYVVLAALLIRGVMLEGAVEGIKYFITPNFKMLLKPDVWIAAATQIFFSVGVGFSVHIAYASYNNFHTPVHNNCLIAAAVNSLTSLFSGFVIFAYLGYMSHQMRKPLEKVVNGNLTLIFIVYPLALSTLPGGNFWAVIFFLMLFNLGLDSSVRASIILNFELIYFSSEPLKLY